MVWNGSHNFRAPVPTVCKLLCWGFPCFLSEFSQCSVNPEVGSLPVLKRRNLTVFLWRAYSPTLSNPSPFSSLSLPFPLPSSSADDLASWETRNQTGIPTMSWHHPCRSSCVCSHLLPLPSSYSGVSVRSPIKGQPCLHSGLSPSCLLRDPVLLTSLSHPWLQLPPLSWALPINLLSISPPPPEVSFPWSTFPSSHWPHFLILNLALAHARLEWLWIRSLVTQC